MERRIAFALPLWLAACSSGTAPPDGAGTGDGAAVGDASAPFDAAAPGDAAPDFAGALDFAGADLSGCLGQTPPASLHEKYCGATDGGADICYRAEPPGGL
jgi:hypothetical protein